MKMIRRTILLLFFYLWCFVGNADAQVSATNPKPFASESLLIQTDKQLYIAGETIWMKFYAFDTRNQRISDFSKIGYVELKDQQGSIVSQIKVFLNQGHGSGTIRLPKVLSSGSYTLIAYTQHLRNLGADFFTKLRLIILDPRQPIVSSAKPDPAISAKFSPNLPSTRIHKANFLSIDIKPTKIDWSQREKVSLDISCLDAGKNPVQAELSVSVSLTSPNNDTLRGLFKKAESSRPGKTSRREIQLIYPVETKGMRLHGQVLNPESGQGEPGAEVFLAFPGEIAAVYTTISDNAGYFSFLLPRKYGVPQIVVQACSKLEAPMNVELIDPFHITETGISEVFQLPAEWIDIAEATLQNAQIREAYEPFELPPVYSKQNRFAGIPFYGKPDAHYRLDDYTRFPLPEFFFEIVPEVRVKGKYGEERISVSNEWDFLNQELPPLLLIDGVPVFNQNTFLKINNKLIRSVDVITSPFWLNPRIFDGIIHMNSFDGNARCFSLPETAIQQSYLMLIPQQQFPVPDYDVSKEQKIPDFRNTLYWDPQIKTNDHGKVNIHFPASDAIGTYTIRIEGISNTGSAGSANHTIVVTKSTH